MCFKTNIMSSSKIITASEARYIYQYKNWKTKVLKCYTNIYCNRKCLKQNLTPIMNVYGGP